MILDLRSSRGESTTCEIGLYPGHLEERLTGGTQQTTVVNFCVLRAIFGQHYRF